MIRKINKISNGRAMALALGLRDRIIDWARETKMTSAYRIYGVPHSGDPVAYLVASQLKPSVIVDKLEDSNVILDDVIYTGETRNYILSQWAYLSTQARKSVENKDGIYFGALIKDGGKNTRCVFPWQYDSIDAYVSTSINREMRTIFDENRRKNLENWGKGGSISGKK